MSEPTIQSPPVVQGSEVDIASEILNLGPGVLGKGPAEPVVAETLSPAVPAGTGNDSEPARPAAAQPVVKTSYLFNWPKNVHAKHRKTFEEIKALPGEEIWLRLETIEHLSKGLQSGCICRACMVDRGQVFIVESEEVAAAAADETVETFLGELLDLDEDLIGEFITMPKEAMRFVLDKKGMPKEAVDAWETSRKRLTAYNKFGRRVIDRYLKLPDFQHKELVALGVLMFIDYAKAGQQTLLAIRLQKATKP